MRAAATDTSGTSSRLSWRLADPGPLYALILGLAAFARAAAGGALRMMWADDGKYLVQVRSAAPLESISFLHHGYLNFAATAIATILEPVPLKLTVVGYTAAWATAVALIAWFVACRSRSLFTTEWAPLVAGAAVVLVPIAGYEAVGNIAYIQWYLLAGAAFALVGEAHGNDRVGAAVVLLCCLSAPAAVTLAPFVWWRRERRLVLAAWTVGMSLQSIAILSEWGQRQPGGEWFSFDRILSSFAGSSLSGAVYPRPEFRAIMPLGILLAIIIGHAVAADPRRFRGVGPLLLAALAQWYFTFTSNGLDAPEASRYAIVPAIVAVTIALIAIERSSSLAAIVVGGLALCWIGGFPTSDLQRYGPGWIYQIDQGCDRGTVAEVDVAPEANLETIAVPC